jgi:hypothetical protein
MRAIFPQIKGLLFREIFLVESVGFGDVIIVSLKELS